ncbi:MAG: uroporphyrinogen decarboxylase family protein [Anaerolineae bacterium]|nr:uroporphyrinogen decarboxylase family protein [Anaerolineae bacterium]
MTPRQRLVAVLHRQIPDRVPVCPDISNMVPARRTGKPFWDIYVYKNPPLWKAHIDALKHYNLDGGFELYDFGDLFGDLESHWTSYVVHRYEDGSFVTQSRCEETGKWSQHVVVHTAGNPPATGVPPGKIGLPEIPSAWEEIEGVREWPTGLELWKLIKHELGDQGVLGMPSGASTCVLDSPEAIYEYHDNPKVVYQRRDEMLARVEKRMQVIAQLDVKPDFLLCGGSGSLIWQSPRVFRELALPVLQRVTELAYDLGIPTHVHSCGPERELVKMAALETKLTVIDPLEVPPMGDCDLAELKRLYGDKIVLKGNLHTTRVMLHGTPQDVRRESLKAILAAGQRGGFILSTGDQCGRDTPDENILAMVEACEEFGYYPLDTGRIRAEIERLGG